MSAADRAHGTAVRYKLGPDENGQPGHGCRCYACGLARSQEEANRQRLIAYGQWQPYVDAQRARDHVRVLSAAGIGWRRTAALAGVSTGSMSKLLHGGPGGRPATRRIRPETERKILAVQPGPDALAACALVDAAGTHRRLQALVACGHSQAQLAARLGVLRSNFGTTMASRRVTAATARAVAALYEELWNVPPAEGTHRAKISASRARNYARARGWALPLAWDDDTIDDPATTPAEGWQRSARLSGAETAAEAAELVALEGSRDLAAERMGIKRSTLDAAIRRAS